MDRINLRRTSKGTYHADTMGGYITIWRTKRGWLARFVSSAHPMDGTSTCPYAPRPGWSTEIEQSTPGAALEALLPKC